MRRVGQPPDPARRYRVRPGVYAILPRPGGLLLTAQRGMDLSSNAFERAGLEVQLPGGGIDPGEAPLPALHREVFEETGWHITAPRRLGAFRRFVFMPEYDLWAEKICAVYTARPTARIAPPTEPDHIALTLPIAEALQVLGNDGDRGFVRRYAGL
ncbi:MAG: NUDIX hydrolase [Pseudomonadota bacterium]